jgi:hypothetical protein
VKDGKFNLESEKGTRIEGEVSESEVKGTLTLAGGEPLDYTATPAEKGKTGIGTGAGEGQLKRRWIATANALRGVDDGTGTVKNGVAVTETVGGSESNVGQGGGGSGSGQAVECHNFVTAGCTTDCSVLARERDLLKKKVPQTKDTKIQISNYNKQFGELGGCKGVPL